MIIIIHFNNISNKPLRQLGHGSLAFIEVIVASSEGPAALQVRHTHTHTIYTHTPYTSYHTSYILYIHAPLYIMHHSTYMHHHIIP
jgi:hypothetical protein